MIDQKHKMTSSNPKNIINFIDSAYPKFKGFCYYDENKKCLLSRHEKVDFYFDPFHGVLHVKEI